MGSKMARILVAVALLGVAAGSLLYAARQPDGSPIADSRALMEKRAARRSGEIVADHKRSEPYVDPATPPPLGLPKLEIPADNPMTPEKIELGKQLFFDKRLSFDNTIACATCHDPNKGWANGETVATGIHGQKGRRNVPSILNAAINPTQFWDGRAATLEEQAPIPILDPKEMGMPSAQALEEKLNRIQGYRKQFQAIFGEPVTMKNVAKALATFERTLLTGDAPQDRYIQGDQSAMSEMAKRGFKVFTTKARCSRCHANANLSVSGFANIGIPVDEAHPDLGREEITKSEDDHLAFKVPTLREIVRTAPYMHDGKMKTLEDVIDHYGKRAQNGEAVDRRLRGFRINEQEKAELLAFLREGLSGGTYPQVSEPKLPD